LPRRLIALFTAVLVLGPAASAHAGWFPAQPLDGPSADVVSVGNVDLARDGTGAVGYIKNGDGVPQAWVSRIYGGAWQAPERISFTGGTVTDVKVAAGDGNRLAVAWIADGNVFATVSPGGDTPGGFVPAVQIGGPGAKSLDLDLGVNGAAYAVWQQDANVVAARLQDSTWADVPSVLDIDPAREAGTGLLRPKVAVSAEGYAVATWGEILPDGSTHVWGRRITGMTLSLVPQDLTLPGGNADSPDIDIEDDGSYAWVVFREDVGGTTRTVGRRLVGSQYEAPEFIDAGVPTTQPKVDMSGVGRGYAVAQTPAGAQIFASWLDHDHFQTPFRLDSIDGSADAKPEVASTDQNDSAVAWRLTGADGVSVARARYHDGEDPNGAVGAEVTVSRGDLGPIADPGVFISADRSGDVAVAMVQGTPGARTLAVAIYDRPPGAPFIDSTEAYKRKTRPELRWRPGNDPWGVQTFKVYMDGVVVGQTTNDTLVPATPLKTGKHTWQVESVDRAGQTARSRARTLKIDATAPKLTVKITGKRVAGKSLKITVKAKDSGGSGLDHVTVDYGDKSATSHVATTRHRYKKRGSFKVKVAAVDKAGNVTRKETKLRIKKS
jgi:PKD domain-containing protein